ncbi:MAG: sodium:solute symporter family protein, partial [Planctomycetota bacterium]
LVQTVQTHHGAGGFNPFLNAELGWAFVVFQICHQTAATLTWQTCIARLLSAKDSKTGRKVYTGTAFFFCCRFVIPGLWGMAALATLTPAVLSRLGGADPSLYAMPLFLNSFVPIGLTGLLVAAMLAADMSTDSSYMLTWGSVIYNDIMAPFRRRKPWSERKGILWNRFIVAGIGLYLLVFGLWYELEGDLWAYLSITGTIYLASMSVLLVACCYWKRANSWGAGAAIAAGAVVPIAFLVMQKLPATEALAKQIGPWYSGMAAYVIVTLAMVVGSLLKPGARTTQTEAAAGRSLAEAGR